MNWSLYFDMTTGLKSDITLDKECTDLLTNLGVNHKTKKEITTIHDNVNIYHRCLENNEGILDFKYYCGDEDNRLEYMFYYKKIKKKLEIHYNKNTGTGYYLSPDDYIFFVTDDEIRYYDADTVMALREMLTNRNLDDLYISNMICNEDSYSTEGFEPDEILKLESNDKALHSFLYYAFYDSFGDYVKQENKQFS